MPTTDRETLIRILEVNARCVYGASLIGNPPPYSKALRDWLKDPRIGDLVLEITSHNTVRGAGGKRLGWLRDIFEGPLTRIWTIETLDGEMVIWANADFIRVVESVDHEREIRDSANPTREE